jgi:anti-sigma regulatory factor (Ser/Thr protein kinase)
MTDEITLTIPREPGFEGVAHLVLSGLAVRLNLTIENLEDLQIALESLLDTTDEGGDLTLAMRLDQGELRTVVGPLAPRLLDAIESDLADGGIGLRRVLETTVDDVFVDGDHVTLTKKVTLVDG